MTKNELKELLKENLSICIDKEELSSRTWIKVEIFFDGEVVCEDEINLYGVKL